MNKEHIEFQFSKHSNLTFDEKEKTISGIFVPYGEIADDRNAFIKAGSLNYVKEIPVFTGHWTDPEGMIGIATVLEDSDTVLKGEVVFSSNYKYADNIIAMIRSGIYNGFSVGLKNVFTKEEKGKPTEVYEGVIQEVSVVRRPALEGATIQASRKEVEIMEKLSCADWEDLSEEKRLEALENIFSKKLSVEFLSLIKETQNLYELIDLYKQLDNKKGVK